MNPFSQESLSFVFIFFVPGFISLKTYDLCVSSAQRDFSKSVWDAISFSCINFALLYWLIIVISTDTFRSTSPLWFYLGLVFILFVAPIIWPIVYLKILSTKIVRSKTIHPIAKPWDYVFGHRKSYWVIIHLKDGRNIGGRYDTKSFASSHPAPEQIYLEEVWKLDKKDEFLSKVERSKGLIISAQDFESVEFFQ